MKTAIIGLRFKDEETDGIEEAVSNFYAENDSMIKSMVYLWLKDPNTIQEVFNLINEKEPDENVKKLGRFLSTSD